MRCRFQLTPRTELHPQTLLTVGMNDGDLPVGLAGHCALRAPRQLGYKSLKFVTHITATDSMKRFGKGLGSVDPEHGYSWYAGICPRAVSSESASFCSAVFAQIYMSAIYSHFSQLPLDKLLLASLLLAIERRDC